MERLKTLNSYQIFKIKNKKLKTYSGWCPFKGLSNDTTLMQIQSGRTVPLILTFGAGSGSTLLFPVMGLFILRSFTVVYLCNESLPWDKVYFIFCICRFLKTQAESLELPWKITECVAGKPIFVLTWEGTEPSLPSVMLNSHTGQLETFFRE